jgi:hypothetical protein
LDAEAFEIAGINADGKAKAVGASRRITHPFIEVRYGFIRLEEVSWLISTAIQSGEWLGV